MRRREFMTLVGSATACAVFARALHPDRARRIGMLAAGITTANDRDVRPASQHSYR
jgi:hypothetical protein